NKRRLKFETDAFRNRYAFRKAHVHVEVARAVDAGHREITELAGSGRAKHFKRIEIRVDEVQSLRTAVNAYVVVHELLERHADQIHGIGTRIELVDRCTVRIDRPRRPGRPGHDAADSPAADNAV